jgi:hypothetical protein
MKAADSKIPTEMNWADYCDMLTNERFARRTQPPKPAPTSEEIPQRAAFASTLREIARELT